MDKCAPNKKRDTGKLIGALIFFSYFYIFGFAFIVIAYVTIVGDPWIAIIVIAGFGIFIMVMAFVLYNKRHWKG